MGARRYNKGKLRYELISSIFKKELARVYTAGAEKYTIYNKDGTIKDDGANNWRKGLPWMEVLGSALRHLEKFQMGEDYDSDIDPEITKIYGKTLHLAHAAWNIATIIDFMETHPELDDRLKQDGKTKQNKRIRKKS